MRYELSDFEWSVVKPMLPNKPRGMPHVDDRRVLNGIFWVLRSGAPWRDLPGIYGPCCGASYLTQRTRIDGEASPRSKISIRPPVAQSRNICRSWMTQPSARRRRSSRMRSRRPIRRPATPLRPTPSPLMPIPTTTHRSEACGDYRCRGDDGHSPSGSRRGQNNARPHG